jgi:calcium-translocating P-type ATPase
MKIHQFDTDEALNSLKTKATGLSSHEAQRRLLEYGANQIDIAPRESLLWGFAKEFVHFFALILWLAAGLAFFAESQQPGSDMDTLGFAILGVILINGVFAFWQQFRAEQAMTALQKLLPQSVKALRDGKIGSILAADLVPGDLIVLQEGDNVPADCRVIEAMSLRVNNATVTGESMPQARNAEPCDGDDLFHARNILLAGTSIMSGEATAAIFATGMHSEFGKIAHLTQTAGASISPLQLEIIRLSRIIAMMALCLGAVFFLIGQSMGLSFWDNFIFAIGIIVANVPEGLLPTVTLSLAMATQRMAKRNALIRHLPSVEALGAATVICTDKTGTLTENRMEAVRLYLNQQLISAAEIQQQAELQQQYQDFFIDALLCQNLKTVTVAGKTQLSGDPMEIALVTMANSNLKQHFDYPKINEIGFDTYRKRLSTIHQTPTGIKLYCKGALEMLLPLANRLQIGAEVLPITAQHRQGFTHALETMATDGLRILAFAWRDLDNLDDLANSEQNLILGGLVGLADPPRSAVPAAISKCKTAGIKVIMVTGDHPHTALAIGRQIGQIETDNPVVISGDQLRKLSPTQLQLTLDAPELIFARVAADQKMLIVQALKNKKQVVAVTGDGVNDAPALKMADIGIAMGISGTDVAKQAADMILLDDDFASIVAAIEEGRAVYANIRKFLTYILTSNVPELVPYLAFALFKIPLPLTIIQILAVDLGTDMLPALGLGADKPEAGIMAKPPRPSQQRLLNWPLVLRAYLFLGLLEAAAAMAAYYWVLQQAGWVWGQSLDAHNPVYLQATTACLSAIILMQVVNVFICKNPNSPLLRLATFSNPLVISGVVLELVLIMLIVYTPWGNQLFGTAPIALEIWYLILPCCLLMLIFETIRKSLAKRWLRIKPL